MTKVAKPGDSLLQHVTASWFNEQNKRRNQARANQVIPYPENPISVPCIADTGIDLACFDAANIVGPAIPYEDFDGSATQYSTASVKINNTLTQDKWGIVQGPCLPGQPSHLILAGVTWANFAYTAGHTYVDVVGGALVSSNSGKGLILSPPEAPGKPGLILIQGGKTERDTILAKTPSGGIPAATGTGPYTWGTATCTLVNTDGTLGVDTETVINIVNMAIASNVVIKAELVGSIYVVDVASCGAS